MKFPYRSRNVRLFSGQQPVTVFRPIARVLLHGPSATVRLNALFDTGADHTMFPERFAQLVGITLNRNRPCTIRGIGGSPMTVYPGDAELELTDGVDSYRWKAEIFFAPANNVLMGHLATFEYFTATFDHQGRTFELIPNTAFPGLH